MIRVLSMAATLTLCASPALPNARITVLLDVLEITEVVDILRAEGFAYGDELDADMLEGQGGAFWRSQIAQIYDADLIFESVRGALENGLTVQEIDAAIAFFGSNRGSRIIGLENAARRAMADPTVEDAARALFEEKSAASDPRVALVTEFVAVNDLLERNVTGAMSANVRFYMGLSDGGYSEETEAQIIAEVWSQQEGIRNDTESWLNGFLFMAYQPLSSEVMQGYIDYSISPEGQALNAALFEGFEQVYQDVSYALGRAIALNAEGDEI